MKYFILYIQPLVLHTLHPALEDGTDRGFRNVGKLQSDAGEIPKRIHTRFKTRRKFEIKNTLSFVTSVRQSVRIENLGSHWTNFHEIWYVNIFGKSVDKIKALMYTAAEAWYHVGPVWYFFRLLSEK